MFNNTVDINLEFPEKLQCLFQPSRYKVLHGGRGGAKCFGLGTKVLMFDGTIKKVEDVKVGDFVMGPDSCPREVLSTTRGKSKLYRVSQTSAIDYVVNEDHILSLKKSESSKKDGRYIEWPDITNIPLREYFEQSARWKENFRGYRAGLVFFEEHPVTIDPYFLGVWLGDGTARELRITNMDQEIIDYCAEYAAQFNLGLSLYRKAGQLAYDVGFPHKEGRSNLLWTRFKRLGLANDKYIPWEYIANSEYVRLQLLAGYIDTDGSLHHNGYVISQTKLELARGLKKLADTLGFRTSFTKVKTYCNGKIGVAYRVSISGDCWRIPVKLPRKKIWQEDVHKNKDFLLSQVTVSLFGEGEYAGFSVNGDHLFLLEDGTVVHNSWGIARALLFMGAKKNLQILCARELQNSIEESVHKLLSQQIEYMNLSGLYVIEKKHIYCPTTGTMFSFEGIARNVNKIRSFEGVDICWVEEAHKVSRASWRVLIPTIRKEGSEIWISFNPELETDETYDRFVKNAPPGAVVVSINWRDNPWFPDVLRAEMELDKKRDYDEYLHIWEGHCLANLKGAVYAKELRRAREENRITHVAWERSVPVDTFWDLGRRDMTGIWFAQRVAMQYRVLRYLEDSQEHISFYMKELDRLPYIYGTHHLPHDAKAKTVGAKYSVEQQVRGIGTEKRKVRVLPRTKIFDGISASRMLFDQCWFHEPDCADGIQHLSHYRYDVSESGLFSNEPLHDEHSHCADAFRTMGVAYRPPKETKSLDLPDPMNILGEPMAGLGWMR